jgi:hypothetical protein
VLSKMSRTGATLTRTKARYRWAAVLAVLLGGGTVATIGGPVSPASAAITRLEATVFNVLDFPATRAGLESQCRAKRGTVTDLKVELRSQSEGVAVYVMWVECLTWER